MRRRVESVSLVIVLVGTLGLLGCAGEETDVIMEQEQEPAEEAIEDVGVGLDEPDLVAQAELIGRDGTSMGTVTFTQHGETADLQSELHETDVKVHAEVHGVTPAGLHGIHIHEKGDCSAPDFSSAGGHYDPHGAPHSCPPDPARHVGDLGNIEVDEDGNGELELELDLLNLVGEPVNIVDRAVILHSGEDDCTTQPAGDSGERIACGRIVLLGREEIAEEMGDVH